MIYLAKRPIFISSNNNQKANLILKKDIDFEWFPGFAVTQKQKSIQALHEQIKYQFPNSNILEISSKSLNNLGVELSAFNLKIHTKNNKSFSVESAFQGSKVFSGGGPFDDLFLKTSKEAKKDPRLKNSGTLIAFKYLNRVFPLEPKTFFYNWLYVNALNMNSELSKEILKYDIFTDIEFNPKKSINCQAEAAAIYVSLVKQNKIKFSLESKENFKESVYTLFENQEFINSEQLDLF